MLHHLLHDAPAAFLRLLAVGKELMRTVNNVRDSVLRSAGGKLESTAFTRYLC